MTAPPRGRPRSTTADAAILNSTYILLATGGYDAVSMEAVAAHAGVGKATVYRRYTCRAELVAATVQASLEAANLEADRGSLRRELQVLIDGYSGHLGAVMAEVSLRLVAEAVRDERARAAVEALVGARREGAAAILARAATRGELLQIVDPDTLLDLIGGGVLVHCARHGGEVSAAFAEQLLDLIVTGLTSPAAPRVVPRAATAP